jgi:hypothetical protein
VPAKVSKKTISCAHAGRISPQAWAFLSTLDGSMVLRRPVPDSTFLNGVFQTKSGAKVLFTTGKV